MAAGEMNKTQLVLFGNDRQPEEFYDLENDPHEIHNLAKDPKFAADLGKHREMLAGWIAETGDKGQEPESDIGLRCALKRWGAKCVNPEYDRVRPKAGHDAIVQGQSIPLFPTRLSRRSLSVLLATVPKWQRNRG